jgi:hypothetical protein
MKNRIAQLFCGLLVASMVTDANMVIAYIWLGMALLFLGWLLLTYVIIPHIEGLAWIAGGLTVIGIITLLDAWLFVGIGCCFAFSVMCFYGLIRDAVAEGVRQGREI